MAVRPLLEFYGELRGGRKVTAEVNQWLERLDLADWADRKVETLSKGMSQQRAIHRRRGSRSPKLLILDEPFSGLDPVSADASGRRFSTCAARGVTVILSTHDMSVAESMCDSHLHDLPRQESARRHARFHPGSVRQRYHPGCRRGRFASFLRNFRVWRRFAIWGRFRNCAWRAAATLSRCLRVLVARTRMTSFSI